MFALRSAVAAGLSLVAFAFGLSPVARAQSGDVVITANTTWPTASYSVNSLTVQGGAVLTVGGGSTVTVANGVAVTGSSSIVLQSINNTGKVNGAYVGAGVTVQAGAVQVDAGSSINADGQGYVRRQGPGGSTYSGQGGSYGGVGGANGGDTSLLYGSAAMPVDLGSGSDGAGGGAIRLIVTGTLTVNGTISANGENVVPGGGGAGSGGSVWVTAGSLAGGGRFAANGGSNAAPNLSGAPAGGGGRLAVYYASLSGFTNFAGSTAAGGQFTGTTADYAGGNGTSAFVNTLGNGSLAVYQAFSIPAGSTVRYDSITVQGGAVLTVGGGSTVTVTGGVTVTGNSSIVMQSINNSGKVNGAYVGAGVTLQAATVQVDAGSSITADKQGYLSSARVAEAGGASGGSGGSYGGLGGYYPGPVYGSAAAPVDLGSGGAGAQYYGSNGGGAVRLIVSGLLTNNGMISANGEAVLPSQGGAGAGGSVYVTAGSLAGAGSFTANGGANTTPQASGAAAGGGGRVAVYYAGPTSFSGFAGSTASGGVYTGAQTGYAGADGTAVFVDTSAPNGGDVRVYGSGFQVPAGSTVAYNSLTVGNHAAVTVGSGSAVSVAAGVTVQGGATLTVGGGSTVTVAGGVVVTGNSAVVLQSINNSGKVGGAFVGAGVTLKAATVQVDAGSSINADGQGYLSSARVGEAGGAYGGSGGSYGGLGGYSPGPVYGSASAPVDLGSGGAGAQYFGSNGGGAVRLIVSGLLTNDGTISANGADNLFCTYGGCGGGGAGGSVYVTTAGLAGAGSFTANGGANRIPTNNGSATGGGGRVAVYYAGPTTFTGFAASTASGGVYTGSLAGYAGANGTSVFVDTSAGNGGNASVYQHFEVPANASVQYNGLTVGQGSSMTLGGGSQLGVTQAMRVTGTMTALAVNTTAQVNSKWVGKGVVIAAGSLQIDSTGSINADSQGYPQADGPGAGGYITGGSYGGLGGGQAASTLYGSAQAPVDLGSGGGGGQNTGGGTGGGAVELLVAGTFQNDGSVSANGGSLTQSGYGGGGAGGSVFVQANTLAGAGTLSANGGSNLSPGAAGNGGGGGRISVSYLVNSGVARSSLSVNGGTGAVAGGVGTVSFVQAAGLQWLLPSKAAVHGTAALQWAANAGTVTTVTVGGPKTGVLATSGVGLSNATWDTTAYPDGAYELRLTASDGSGTVGSVSRNVVVNNSVQWVSGTLTADTHWTAGKVYAIEGDVIVPFGVTLTIDAGVVVKSLANYQILVQNGGTLTSLGADGAPVVFTTFDDATAGGNTSFSNGVPQPGAWGGVNVAGGGTFNSTVNTFVRYGQGVVGNTLTTDTTLLSSQAYEISGTLTVSNGVTLTIQPGAVLKFDSGAGIRVNAGGKLIANGTLAQPIYLTSINDQSVGANLILNGNPAATLTPAAAGDWNSIHVEGMASFNYVHMLYGGGPIPTVNQEGMLESAGNATITLANSVLAYSYYIGIQTGLSAAADTYTITNTTFFSNQERAINVYPGSTVHVVNSTFDGNAGGPFNHGGSMDIANSVVTGFFNTQFGGVGGPVGTFTNNDVWTSVQGVPSYTGGLTDQTGLNGNISANPVYVSAAQHDYRPNYGSPLIDAANGTVANYPATDAYNDPRYNAPLVTAKKGVQDAAGKYPDMGAFEFVQSAPSTLDLTPSAVQGPATAVVGTQVQVTWTVTNIGAGTVYGPWHDAVYLVRDPLGNPVEIYAGEVLSGQGVVLGPGAVYRGSGTITVPGTVVGPHAWEVRTNTRGEVFEGSNTANNKAVGVTPVQVDVPVLSTSGGTLSGSFAAAGQAVYYKLMTMASAQPTRVQLALPAGVGSVQLFVGGGYVASSQHYDLQQAEFNSATATVVVPAGTAQTYYITAYPQQLAASPAAFTLSATSVSFALTGVSPASAPNGAKATVTFSGGNFTSRTAFSLVSASGVSIMPSAATLFDTDNALVTFDLTRVAAGAYTAQAVDGQTLTLPGAFTVTAAGASTTVLSSTPQVEVTLETPAALRAGFSTVVTLHYRSTAKSDIPAPLISVAADNATLTPVQPECDGCDPNLTRKLNNTYTSGLLLGINREGPAGVLPAGASGSMQFVATPTSTATVVFSASALPVDPVASAYTPQVCEPQGGRLQVLCNPTTQTGAYTSGAEFCGTLAPAGVANPGFARACMQMLNNAGYRYTPVFPLSLGFISGPYPSSGTSDGYVGAYLPLTGLNKVLADDATALSAAGIYEQDMQKVLGYELEKDGMKELSARYHQGAFGYGPSHPFDITLALVNGTPVVTYPDGTTRSFGTASTTQTGVFLGPVGDYATVARDANTSALNWLLTEADGIQYHFVQSGAVSLLDYVQDRNGNRTQMNYTGGLLTGVADGFGNSTTLTYDQYGHVISTTNSAGASTTYTYDTVPITYYNGVASTFGSFLTSATDASGTTRFTWNEGGPHPIGFISDACIATFCDPAIGITSVAYPDGTHTNFTYDAAGRLTGSSRDGGAEAIVYTHNADGSLTATDAQGRSTTASVNTSGGLTALANAAGQMLRFRRDAENKLTGAVGPLGDSSLLSYDGAGNVSGLTTGAGSLYNFAFDPLQTLNGFTDASGSVTKITNDAKGVPGSLVFPDGRAVAFTHDAAGHLASRTNRRGSTTSYTYNTNGKLTGKTYSDGTQVAYTYDGAGNLASSTTAAGTSRYGYDAAKRLTSVTNGDGTSIAYTYNSNGQRSRMTDSAGSSTSFTYDAVGRLAKVVGADGTTIVAYTYDASGAVVRKVFGNGTSTSLTYDAAGNVAGIVHASPSQTPLASYAYSYNAGGDPVGAVTPAGQVSYAYDLDGQLTGVTTTAGTTSYTYDAAGNRSAVTTNGVTTNYQVNNLGQYASVGATGYVYDADGNLTSGNGWTYRYNEENKLIGMANATDTWTFQYDGLNQRVGSVHNGVATRYLVDPSDYGNVVAELDGSGNALSHYTYGLELVSTVQSGTTAYYHYDAVDNTTLMTGASGAVVNSYAYTPFGQKTVLAAGVANPYTFGGAVGIREDSAGQYVTRNRAYNASLGRFQQLDPSGPAGGLNLYAYGQNAPTRYVDATGQFGVPPQVRKGPNPLDISGPSKDPLENAGNSGAGHVLNAIGGELPGGLGKGFGGVSAVLSADSFLHSAARGDVPGAIHDFTLTAAGALSSFIPEGADKPNNPLGVLLFTVKHLGAIDEASQGIFNHLLIPDDPIPDGVPVTQLPNICGKCFHRPGNTKPVPVNGSIDPNGKLTSGFGDQGFIPTGAPISYTVYFENLPTATLPAQKVVVTDALDAKLDWSTVQLRQISFNNVSLQIPDGTQTYRMQASVATDANPVSVTASLNAATGLLTWTMQSVSATTGGAPADPLAGFLPPNDSTNTGTGAVVFTVMPKAGLSNGTTIANQASIVFDVNAAIVTNSVTNTIDSSAVTSSIAPMAATTVANASHALAVSWSGTDNGGSGIAWYDIYASVDGGLFQLWLSGTSQTSATYAAAYPGHSYSFVSVATNNAGIVQAMPGLVQTSAVVLQTPLVTVTPASATILSTQALPMQVAVTGSGTPTGSVMLAGGTFTSSAVSLQNGVAAFTIPAGALATGAAKLTATYVPDNASDALFQAASGTATVTVTPPAIAVQVGTSPAGLGFTVDGTAYTATQSLSWTIGSTHTIATASPQTVGGMSQSFGAWSDGGAISHTVTASAGSSSYTATFAATPLPVVSLTPASLSFTAAAGATSAAQSVQLVNAGSAVLTLSGISVTGNGAAAFAQTNTCGASLAAGAGCTIAVTFGPSATGSIQAALAIGSNAAGTATVALMGTGTAAPTFTLGVTPASQTVAAGGTVSYGVTLTPQGGAFTGAVALSVSGLPPGATATFAPASVTPGSAAGSSTLTIRVPVTTSGLRLPGHSATAPLAAFLGCLLIATRRRRGLVRGLAQGIAVLVALICLAGGMTGCGTSNPSTGSTSTTSTVTITATSGSQTQTATVSLTVTR